MNQIRMIIALFIVCGFMPLSSLAFRYASGLDFDYDEINDEIALYQLRELLLISYDLEMTRDCLYFRYQDKDFRLSVVNGKLILQPGTQIFLNGVDDLYFDETNGCIHVFYEKEEKSHNSVIAQRHGIHLDGFSHCAVSGDEPDDDEE